MSIEEPSERPGGATGAALRRTWIEWLCVGGLVSVLVLWLSLAGGAIRTDNLIYDRLMSLGHDAPDDRILIVGIDNRSLEALGGWPWSRRIHAALIDRLAEAGSAAVAYDVLFLETGEGDAALARSLREARNVYLPMAVDPLTRSEAAAGQLRPVPALADAAAGLGHVNLTVDPDGVLRRAPLRLSSAAGAAPHLMVSLLERGESPPATSQGSELVLLNWVGPPGSFRSVSFLDVLRGEVPSSVLAGKLVLVGMTADGQGDRYAASAGGGLLYPGVEVQATLLDTLLGGRPIQPAPPWLVALISLSLLWGVHGALLFLGPTRGLVVAVGAAVGVGAATTTGFHFNAWLPPTSALAGLALVYPLWSWRRLEAAHAWFRSELKAFQADGEAPAGGVGGDAIQRQLASMAWALGRLRDLRRFIADALRSLPDATLVVDAGERVLMANDRAERLFDDQKLVGQELPVLLDRLGTGSDRTPSGEIATGDGRMLHRQSARLISGSGMPVAQIVRLADVTQLRQAQRQREEALQLLSHDMRAPQISTLTLLQRPNAFDDPETLRRVAENARMTLRMAEGYVQLARAESQAMAREPVDLLEALMDAADTLWPQADARGVRIVLPTEGAEALVTGDRGLLTRVFLNLLDNAVRYSPEGGQVRCEVASDEAVLTCSVEDCGPGVPCDRRERIFRRFEQVGDHSDVGHGLGLALVRTVLERHGGSVRCEDRAGGGARFLVQLPRLPH